MLNIFDNDSAGYRHISSGSLTSATSLRYRIIYGLPSIHSKKSAMRNEGMNKLKFFFHLLFRWKKDGNNSSFPGIRSAAQYSSIKSVSTSRSMYPIFSAILTARSREFIEIRAW